MLDGPRHRQLAAGEPRFADAVEAFVGIHDHEQVIALPAPHRVCLDAGYLHAYLLFLLKNDGTREVCFKQPATRYCKLGGWWNDSRGRHTWRDLRSAPVAQR